MRIGIDIDNVISSFDNELLKEYIKHDKELRNTGIVNENAANIRKGMFDWSEEEDEKFYKENIERIAINLKPIKGAKKYIDKLKQDGNEIYIISGRDNNEYTDPMGMTKNWLEKYKIYYDRLILTNAYDNHSKTIECKNNKIDIMIEDRVSIATDLKNNGIRVLLMNTRFNKTNTDFERVKSWKEIYYKIAQTYPKKEIEKINVILDTDPGNECDDQFAISYLIKSQDRFNIDAITLAPWQHDNEFAIEEGMEKSYKEILKISKWLNFDIQNKVFKGSTDYISNGYNETNEAVQKIIELALKNKKTYIIAIGAITNVAMAIKKEPKIIEKIEVVWLGGNNFFYNCNDEFNFMQDVQAVKIVFESKVNLTILPCKGVASNLMISIYELEHYMKGKNDICNYLYDIFYDDGIHGPKEKWPIWDIGAVAYLINKDWFEKTEINYPNINDDLSYDLNTNNHLITMVNYLDSINIYRDLFKKLGED